MKVYLQTDIEGIAGFCFFENRKDASVENFHHRQRMRRLLTNEVNAAAKAAFRAGAAEVIINDNHGAGYNILFEELDPRCRIIHGRNGSGPHWLPLFTECDVMVLVGMHAMGGTPVSITPHSLWKVNDGALCLSEASMAAAIAGDHGIPVVFASGDDKVTAELAAKIPGIATVVTKQALAPFMACSLIPARACELIGEAVERALRAPAFPAPFVIPGPVTLTLLDSANHAPPLAELKPAVTADTIEQAFLQYERDMPWSCGNQQLPDGFVYP
jgi:D-amino peptidase